MKFKVTIRREGGPNEIRTIEAASRFEVYDQVKNEGGVVASIEEHHRFFTNFEHLNITIGTGIKRTEIIHTAKNLAAMLFAGLSISRALSIIERQSNNTYLKKVITGVAEKIRGGSSFHEALATYPKVFPELFVAMARAGEESGSLGDSLNAVALQEERSEELSRKIKGAMIYPTIVIFAVVIVAVLMLIYVVPTLTSTFESLGTKVPLATRVIVAISNFAVDNVTFVIAGLSAFFASIFMFVRSKTGKNAILTISLHIPVIGELVRETYAARASRTLSSLLSAGVPILESLAIAKQVVRAEVFARVIEEAGDHVKKGELLSASFSKHTNLYPILMSDMLAVGEETGKVTDMLKQIAEFYESDVSEKTKDLSTIIEPVLMLVIGAAVGVFAVAMVAPIYQLSSAIG